MGDALATPIRTEWSEKVEPWRLHVLCEAGYPVRLAEQLAADSTVDLHRAVEMIERGCKPATATEILLS